MADQENAHEEITHGPGYTPSYSPLGITPSPSTTHAHLATPNESIVAHEAEETTDNLEGTTEKRTSRLKSEIWKHFKKIKANEEDKDQCNYCFKLLGGKSKNGTKHQWGHKNICI